MMFPFLKEALINLFSRPSTVKFPKVNVEAKPGYRGRIAYDPEKCVNCGMCMKVCAGGAITRTSEDVEGGEKISYFFDMSSCTFCGMCQDFCSTRAIQLTQDYHMVACDYHELITTGSRIREKVAGKLSCGEDCVYCGLCMKQCPEGAISVDRKAKTWVLDESKCVKCGVCVSKCPKKCLAFEEPARQSVVCDESCVFCGLCSKKCPVGAITVDRASKSWSVDDASCIRCGACIEACRKNSLSMQ